MSCYNTAANSVLIQKISEVQQNAGRRIDNGEATREHTARAELSLRDVAPVLTSASAASERLHI
jgi:hypothetical protein